MSEIFGWILLGVLIVSMIFIYCVFDYKKSYLEYLERSEDNTRAISLESVRASIEIEKTKQLQLKADYKEKFGEYLS